MFIYDVTRKYSFDGIKKIYNGNKDLFGENKIIYLIGNKIDLYDKNKKDILFEKNEIMKFVEQNNLRFFEISCKENIGISKLFADICYETIKNSEKFKKVTKESYYLNKFDEDPADDCAIF